METELYDVVIVGGGPAGQSAALQLGRYRWKTVVLDKGKGRAAFVPDYRNLLGFPDGISGEELLTSGRAQLESLGIKILPRVVISVVKEADGLFKVTAQGVDDVKQGSDQNKTTYRCRKLVLGTGIMDNHPEVPNVFRWAGHAIYYCPDCDGYEIANKRVTVVGKGNGAAELALALLNWTSKIQVVNVAQDKPISSERITKLEQQGIPIYSGALREFVGAEKARIDKVILEDGTELVTEKVFSALGKSSINSGLAKSLGAQTLDNGHIVIDPRTKETSVQGCWAVGDVVAAHSQQVSLAIADGVQAAIWINKRLREEGQLPGE